MPRYDTAPAPELSADRQAAPARDLYVSPSCHPFLASPHARCRMADHVTDRPTQCGCGRAYDRYVLDGTPLDGRAVA